MPNYYNEFDPFAAQWLRNLITAGHLPAGEVDERSITEVHHHDLREFTQCHFFAGIGGWPYALRLAGWPDDRPVWTGSCPCQPFSSQGARKGIDDERHLWPIWFSLIQECKPDIIFGEQVDEAIREGWLETVRRDMEGISYALAPFVLSSRSAGAIDERYRLWFVANAPGVERIYESDDKEGAERLSNDKTFWQACPWDETKSVVRMLDHGLPSCVGIYRGFGNAINAQVAKEFVSAFMEYEP